MNGTIKRRCAICGAIIPQDQRLCTICESTYPCDNCTNKVKSVCMCNRWKRWFHLQWEKFYRKKN